MNDNTCKKVKDAVIDVKVEADLSRMLRYERWKTNEEYIKLLQNAISEFESFLRDHRSQDLVSLYVIKIKEDKCSVCGNKWETYTDGDGNEACSGCGRIIEKEEFALESDKVNQ